MVCTLQVASQLAKTSYLTAWFLYFILMQDEKLQSGWAFTD